MHEENDFWSESNSAKAKVINALKNDNMSNATRWELLTSSTTGLGLLGTLADGRSCVQSFKLHIDVVDWHSLSVDELVEKGGLFLAATTAFTWDHGVSKRQRALLLKHFPSLAVRFPWAGCVQVSDLGLNAAHAPFLAAIANGNPDVVELSAASNELGDETVSVLRDELPGNNTLLKVSLCDCGLTDDGAAAFAALLRGNRALEYCWLMDNRGIGDAGALSLAAALTDGDDANGVLRSLYMRGTGVTKSCQQKCIAATDGRMEFD